MLTLTHRLDLNGTGLRPASILQSEVLFTRRTLKVRKWLNAVLAVMWRCFLGALGISV